MDPITMALMGGNAVGGLIDGFMNRGQQRRANNIAMQNLIDQRNARNETMHLARSDRTDAYGNTVAYEEGRGFVTKLTPLQKAIMDAQQGEQLAGLKRDAPRQRAAAERMDARSQDTDAVFQQLMTDYNTADRTTQKEEEANSILLALEDRKVAPQQENSMNAAIRTGYAPSKTGGGETLTAALMRAKQGGKDNFIRNDGALAAKMMQELGGFKSMADGTATANIDMSNQNAALGAKADGGLASLIQAIQAGAAGTSNAMGQFKFPESSMFGDLAKSLTGSFQGMQQQGQQQKNLDRQYGLDYFNATGQFPT